MKPIKITPLKSIIAGAAAVSFLGTAAWANEPAPQNIEQVNITVAGMTCPFCVATSEKALKAKPGVHAVESELKSGLIAICMDTSAGLDDAALTQLFKSKGFTFKSAERAPGCTLESFQTKEEAPKDDSPHSHYGSGTNY